MYDSSEQIGCHQPNQGMKEGEQVWVVHSAKKRLTDAVERASSLYYYVTNHHKLRGLKQHNVYYFCGLGICTRLSWILYFRVSHEIVIKVLTGLRSNLKAQVEKNQLPVSLTWLLARLSSSGLLDRGSSQFLAKWAYPTWWLASSKIARESVNRGSLLVGWKLLSLIT